MLHEVVRWKQLDTSSADTLILLTYVVESIDRCIYFFITYIHTVVEKLAAMVLPYQIQSAPGVASWSSSISPLMTTPRRPGVWSTFYSIHSVSTRKTMDCVRQRQRNRWRWIFVSRIISTVPYDSDLPRAWSRKLSYVCVYVCSPRLSIYCV